MTNFSCILTENSLQRLHKNIGGNIPKYKFQNKEWLGTYFEDEKWYVELDKIIPIVNLKIGQGPKDDLDNVKIFYSAMKDFDFDLITDERFWVFLTHVTYYGYMTNRWNMKISKGHDENSFIKRRYFFNGTTYFKDNGLARLFWFGHSTYDKNGKNDDEKFYLTKYLIGKQDIANNLFNNNLYTNPKIMKSFLKVLSIEPEIYNKQPLVRNLLLLINRESGVVSFDALEEGEIIEIIQECIRNLNILKQ